jgi:arginyl-tRNA synthetase
VCCVCSDSQYAHARVTSILHKASVEAGVDIAAIAANAMIDLQHPSEFALASEIARFQVRNELVCIRKARSLVRVIGELRACAPCHQDVVELFYKQLYPNCFADYCFRVAVKFSDFFRDCRVMGSPEQTSRLLLCLCVQTALRTVFHLLGIDPVDRV